MSSAKKPQLEVSSFPKQIEKRPQTSNGAIASASVRGLVNKSTNIEEEPPERKIKKYFNRTMTNMLESRKSVGTVEITLNTTLNNKNNVSANNSSRLHNYGPPVYVKPRVGHFRNTFQKAEQPTKPPADPSQNPQKEAFIRRLQKNFVKTKIEKNTASNTQERNDTSISKPRPAPGPDPVFKRHLNKLSQITNNNRSALLDQKRNSTPFHSYLMKDLCSAIDHPKPPPAEKSLSKEV